ncbi:MAG: ankyrin repeat domain-containing protein, partial [Gammaproteobacteria bacterium]|nr:ankyrin repeat domain-containing protein [Gammaproteobacteria bacterium]
MKHILITTIAAVVVVGCGNPEADKALRFAATKGNIEAAKQAIDDGADVNAKDKRGKTPLLRAAIGGHKEIAEILIAKGADVSPKSPEYKAGITPLHEAAFHGHMEIVELL